jgi:hypothetical protein
MADLVDVSDYKTYAGINSSTRDAAINNLKTQVSTLIKTYCGRTFIDYYTAEKTEYFDIVEGESSIFPTELPIKEVIQLYERDSSQTDKQTVELNHADSSNYYLLSSGTAQCTLSGKTTEAACINNDTFSGSGSNDLTITGYNAMTTSGEVGRSYKVQIDSAGTPDTFKWSRDGGSNWKETSVAITGSSQILEGDVAITFAGTNTHTAGDSWTFTAERWTGTCSNTGYTTQATCEAAGEFWTVDREYEVDSEGQEIIRAQNVTNFRRRLKHSFPSGARSVKLVYKGGYASVPGDLKLAVYDLITYYLKKEATPAKSMPGSEIKNVTKSQTLHSEFPPHIKRILEHYRHIS